MFTHEPSNTCSQFNHMHPIPSFRMHAVVGLHYTMQWRLRTSSWSTFCWRMAPTSMQPLLQVNSSSQALTIVWFPWGTPCTFVRSELCTQRCINNACLVFQGDLHVQLAKSISQQFQGTFPPPPRQHAPAHWSWKKTEGDCCTADGLWGKPCDCQWRRGFPLRPTCITAGEIWSTATRL